MPSAAPMMNISKAMYGRSFIFHAVAATFFLFHSIRTFVRGALHFVMHG